MESMGCTFGGREDGNRYVKEGLSKKEFSHPDVVKLLNAVEVVI
jgi:hypothetical protein